MAKCSKKCICCGEVLPLAQFPENRMMKDGHLGWCFDCFKLRGTEDGRKIAAPKKKRTRKSPEEVRAKRISYIKAWRQRNIDRVREYERAYYHHHKKASASFVEKRKAYQNEYRKRPDVKPRIAATHAAYYQRNKERLCAYERERYHRKKAATQMQAQC